MSKRIQIWAAGLSLVVAVGCQNADLMRPTEVSRAEDGRTFTRLGDDAPGPLTGAVASRWVGDISKAEGSDRLALIDTFLTDFPAARTIALVHELAGEAYFREGQLAEAAEAYERAVILQRTDLLGLPLESDLVLRIGTARMNGGAPEDGLEWMVRASLIDRSTSVDQTLRWAYQEAAIGDDFDRWIAQQRRRLGVVAPRFDLPGFQEASVALEPAAAKVTVINFWSPT